MSRNFFCVMNLITLLLLYVRIFMVPLKISTFLNSMVKSESPMELNIVPLLLLKTSANGEK